MKYIGIIGSRRRDSEIDFLVVSDVFFNNYEKGDVIVSGGCPKGADSFAERMAKENNIRIVVFKADWNKYNKSAGFIRNTDIAKISDTLIACVSKDRTGGTEDTIKKFINYNKQEKLILC